MPWFWEKMPSLGSSMGLISYLKCCFKCISEKYLRNFSLRSLSFVCCRLNIYQSALIFSNLPCPEKFLVTRLYKTYVLQRKHHKNVCSLYSSRFFVFKCVFSEFWAALKWIRWGWYWKPKRVWFEGTFRNRLTKGSNTDWIYSDWNFPLK